MQPAVAVRFCPVLFELKEEVEGEREPSPFQLPYRMVFAVATADSLVLYDTQVRSYLGLSCVWMKCHCFACGVHRSGQKNKFLMHFWPFRRTLHLGS